MKCISLFTRFPEPGKAKTRLIPTLGAEQAAALQHAMTGHTVLRARLWTAAERDAETAVRFTGAPKSAFQKWLGAGLVYHPQGEGDLGQRMAEAVESSFESGATEVVLLGCDCPDASPELLSDAFRDLETHDIVIGPAQDGGYYLIGMKRPCPELFDGPDWGTASVHAQTWKIIRSHSWSCKELARLHDVDEVESLPHWQRHVQPHHPRSISVVIPALNEAANIKACVQSALPGAAEVLVVDGGSSDHTVEQATAAGARVLRSPKGRAVQMNRGAWMAQSEYLVFLHADSRLPTGYADAVRSALESSSAGAFELQIAAEEFGYRMIEWSVRLRSRWFQRPYGDQALFVSRTRFLESGGFSHIPIMEDLEWVKRMTRKTRFALLPDTVDVSARRWQRLGIVRTTMRNQGILIAAMLRVPYWHLAEWYRR